MLPADYVSASLLSGWIQTRSIRFCRCSHSGTFDHQRIAWSTPRLRQLPATSARGFLAKSSVDCLGQDCRRSALPGASKRPAHGVQPLRTTAGAVVKARKGKGGGGYWYLICRPQRSTAWKGGISIPAIQIGEKVVGPYAFSPRRQRRR